jgi:hypothetical protein
MVHATEPGEVLKKFLAERCLQPGEVFMFGRPTTDMILFLTQLAKDTPGMLALARINTAPHEVASFGCQSQVFTSFSSRRFAKWTVSLVNHGWDDALVSVSR